MERMTLVLKGVKIEVSRKPFPNETASAFKGNEDPSRGSKRPRSDAPNESTEKKAKLAGSPFEKATEIRARLAARFEAAPTNVPEASPPAAPPSVAETTPARFLDLLESLNSVRPFNRTQTELLAKHGICKFKDSLSKQAVWETGANRVVARKPQANKHPRGLSSVNVDEILKALGVQRPACYSKPRALPRCRRPQSQRDISIAEYRQASDSLWHHPQLY